jgi:hypothetical protein
MAVLRELAPRASSSQMLATTLISPDTINHPSRRDTDTLAELRDLGSEVMGLDLASDEASLAKLFEEYDTVLNCSGFVAGPGTQFKISSAVLAAKVKRYFPWQFGVDYDIVGRGSGQPVFDEQYAVRQLLRSQQNTEWVIISTAMFTSFLFEPAFDVVNMERKLIRALGSWEIKVTVTSPGRYRFSHHRNSAG